MKREDERTLDFFVHPIVEIIVPNGRTARRDVVDRLKESIARVGVINPITVASDFTLVAGMNRLEACRELGLGAVPICVLPPGAPLTEIELSENYYRRHLTPEQQKEYAALLTAEISRAREQAEKNGEPTSNRAIAKKLGISEATVRRRAGASPDAPRMGRDGKVYAPRRDNEARDANSAHRLETVAPYICDWLAGEGLALLLPALASLVRVVPKDDEVCITSICTALDNIEHLTKLDDAQVLTGDFDEFCSFPLAHALRFIAAALEASTTCDKSRCKTVDFDADALKRAIRDLPSTEQG